MQLSLFYNIKQTIPLFECLTKKISCNRRFVIHSTNLLLVLLFKAGVDPVWKHFRQSYKSLFLMSSLVKIRKDWLDYRSDISVKGLFVAAVPVCSLWKRSIFSGLSISSNVWSILTLIVSSRPSSARQKTTVYGLRNQVWFIKLFCKALPM